MASQARTLLVDEVVPLRQKVPDQHTLKQRQSLLKLLARFRDESSDQHNPLASLRVPEMLHQSKVVKLTLDAAADVASLTDIQSFNIEPPPTTEYVYT